MSTAGSGLTGAYISAHGLKGIRSGFPRRSGENIDCRIQVYVHKSSLLNRIQILSFQESTADSSSP